MESNKVTTATTDNNSNNNQEWMETNTIKNRKKAKSANNWKKIESNAIMKQWKTNQRIEEQQCETEIQNIKKNKKQHLTQSHSNNNKI